MYFRELKSSDIRQVNGFVRRAASLNTVADLEALFMEEIGRILPNDFPVWNNQSMDFMTILSASMPKAYEAEAFGRIDALYAHFNDHPSLRACGGYGTSWHNPMRMSDYISDSKLQENPLFRDFYRHIDSTYQVAMHVVTLSNHKVVITLNNGRRDFDQNFVEKFHYFTLGVRQVASALERQQMLQQRLTALTDLLGTRAELQGLQALTPAETTAMQALFSQATFTDAAKASKISRHTFNERTAVIREKLCLENTAQLRAALCMMQSLGKAEDPAPHK